MNKVLLSISLIILTFLAGCKKELLENMATKIDVGKSEIYMNGDLINYEIRIKNDTINEVFNFSIFESKNDGQLINLLGFGLLPIKEGDYFLHTEVTPRIGALSTFSQTVSGDLEGYSYKLINEEEGFFNIEQLDLNNQTILVNFQACFKRTSKNGNKELGLPKRMAFQGVFNSQL